MANPLNLYATKVFAEHPISMWAMDEQLGYISLIQPEFQNLSNWDISGATIVDATNNELFSEIPPTAPFKTEFVNGLIESSANNGLINASFSSAISDDLIDNDLGSFAIGMYAFTYDRTVQARIGFSYIDSVTLEENEVIRLVNIPANRAWAFVSETFSLPQNFSQIKPIIEFSYTTTELVYEMAINGITVGQWSEEFHTESLGVELEDLPTNIPIDSKSIEALPYGLQGNSGYYLASQNKLYAQNTGVPLVYGSSNSTKIVPNEPGKPSLIVPGEGFMNTSGQYKPLTVEFWTNIQSNTIEDKRIFGPINSDDGIYVGKHLIKLKVGSSVGSHNVRQWGRPMLVAIRLTYNSASLLINGEEVISLQISPETVSYPDAFEDGNSLDWLGFYGYEDVPIINIEAVAIYPYEVAAIVQKRRFVYGQGVDFPISSQGLDNSTVTSIDYSVANYAKNIIYPQINSWSAGYSDNLAIDSNSISLPSYSAPRLFLSSKQESEWLEDSYNYFDVNSPMFSLRPGSSWSEENGYLYFKNLSFLNETPSAFYGVFKTSSDNISKQILFRFEQTTDSSSLNIYLEDQKIKYSIEYLNNQNTQVEEVFYEASGNSIGDVFLVGLNFADASSAFGSRVSSFMGGIQSANLYIGGRMSFENTFGGDIVKVGFSGTRNAQKMVNFYTASGVGADYEDGALASGSNKDSHTATYTLVPSININSFELDVAVDSYWEDYVPLSYFGKYVTDYEGNQFFALDFIQFNIDYVKLQRFSNGNYDTAGLPIKTYVSFQYLAGGANADPNYFTYTQPLSKNSVIRPGDDWLNTRYEILNDSVIKLPVGESIDRLALVISVEFTSSGVNKDNLSIASLELASQALGQSANKIPTKFGTSIIPFRKSGQYFEYKNVEPFTIYKQQSPYLYLTKNHGIRMRSSYSSTDRNGLSIPININRSNFFKVNLFQMFIRYEEENFPIAPVQLFELQTADSLIQFFLVADSNTQQRGQIYAIDQTSGSLKSGIVYYIDGKVVKRPILNLNSWTVLSMSFGESEDFSSYTGALRFTSPILFNHVSYYQTTQLDEIQRFAYRKWSAVRSGIDNPLDWGYWAGKGQTAEGEVYSVSDGSTWQEVLFLTEADPTVPDAEKVFNQYVGTNSTVFDTGSSLRLFDYRSSVLKDIAWNTSISTPV